jgi:hypothetical protein
MTAVQPPVNLLTQTLDSLVVSQPSSETGEIRRQPRKVKLSEEEKKVGSRTFIDFRLTPPGQGLWNLL